MIFVSTDELLISLTEEILYKISIVGFSKGSSVRVTSQEQAVFIMIHVNFVTFIKYNYTPENIKITRRVTIFFINCHTEIFILLHYL